MIQVIFNWCCRFNTSLQVFLFHSSKVKGNPAAQCCTRKQNGARRLRTRAQSPCRAKSVIGCLLWLWTRPRVCVRNWVPALTNGTQTTDGALIYVLYPCYACYVRRSTFVFSANIDAVVEVRKRNIYMLPMRHNMSGSCMVTERKWMAFVYIHKPSNSFRLWFRLFER